MAVDQRMSSTPFPLDPLNITIHFIKTSKRESIERFCGNTETMLYFVTEKQVT
jgi:hypothetical protein